MSRKWCLACTGDVHFCTHVVFFPRPMEGMPWGDSNFHIYIFYITSISTTGGWSRWNTLIVLFFYLYNSGILSTTVFFLDLKDAILLNSLYTSKALVGLTHHGFIVVFIYCDSYQMEIHGYKPPNDRPQTPDVFRFFKHRCPIL